MNRHRDEHLDLCAAQVLGDLAGAERAELESHLVDGCATCEAELRALAGGATVLALSVPQHRAPARARASVLAAFEREAGRGPAGHEARPTPRADIVSLPRRTRPSFATLAWAAAAALLAVAGVFGWQRIQTLERQLATTDARTRELERGLDEARRWAGLLEAPSARVVPLAATPSGDPALAAQVLYDPASDLAIVMAQRFTPPSSKDYELWAITAAGPTSLGVVHADASGRAVVRLERVSREGAVAAFAVSLESAGGSPDHHKPSGPVVMLGKLAG